LKWSSDTVKRAANALTGGAKEVKVTSRSEAEELFLRLYQGEGYRNTTGLSAVEAKSLFGKKGTYHWDEGFDSLGRVQGHGTDNPHGELPHLQIHLFEGWIIRIFYDG
jgi:hypothetical protein